MSSQIVEETLFMYHSVLLGVAAAVIYDMIRIFRRVVAHNRFFLSLEDILYWVFCAWEVFYLLYRESSGVLRWFAILGIALGMFLYMISISRFVVYFVSEGINRLLHIIGKVIGFLFTPVRRAAKVAGTVSKKGCKMTKRSGHFLKKKLTASGKMLRIILCKR